jgi:formate dehydrogenase iron-sulfur subunit
MGRSRETAKSLETVELKNGLVIITKLRWQENKVVLKDLKVGRSKKEMPKISNTGLNTHKEGEKATQLSRRDFLKLSIPAAGLVALGAESTSGKAVCAAPAVPSADATAMLYESSKCLGCRRCEDACRRWNNLDPEYRPSDLSANSLSVIKYREVTVKNKVAWLPSKWQCMHCVDPSCANVCPTGALHKTADGPVLYDEKKCVGCQYCVAACPFSVPRFNWDVNRMIKKCTFCADRQAEGLQPACAGVCPVQALTFGKRDYIMGLAKRAQDKGAFLYGKDEAGGTSWIYTSDVAFEQRGVPSVQMAVYPSISKAMLGPQIGTLAAGAVAIGAYAIFLKNKKVEGEQK